MLLTYLFCFAAGIALISLSLSDDGALDGEGGALSILFSTPFWSFGLTGFGLSGVLMRLAPLLTRSSSDEEKAFKSAPKTNWP